MIHVVAAIIEDEGRYLACRRRPERSHGGLWEFPGGKVEHGESASMALVREIHEELATAVIPLTHFTTLDRGDLRLIFVRARLAAPRPLASTDHDRLEWLTLDELSSVTWAPADKTAVELLQSGRD